jgi:hypothetical protein
MVRLQFDVSDWWIRDLVVKCSSHKDVGRHLAVLQSTSEPAKNTEGSVQLFIELRR